ncbi:L-threonine 3-dehydrogenase [Ephemerocybe angulata]|uniref:L-threonine 3-dehydrogenase n=1 Tax=Ephemerocybe angulata TaxID=980116 RepID=A0A8H6LX63_9AGAR|nr:L-threonine 3-dehydrogenase [Tulosesus angulatus]
MKAARYYGPGDIRVEDIDEPVVGPISAADVHMYQTSRASLAPTATTPNRLTGETLPVTLGHQFSGVIEEVGPGVDIVKWECGQKVSVEPLFSCMRTETCEPCAEGHFNVCPKANFIGIGGQGGGLGEYVAVDAKQVHHLPDNVSLEAGAMLEPLAVAFHAVKRSGYMPGQTILISGAGPALCRSIDTSASVFVSEPVESRRCLAVRYGATEVIDPNSSQGIAQAKVYGETLGVGVDVAFETAGEQDSLDTSLICVRPHGMLVNIAVWQESPSLNLNLVNRREIKLTWQYPEALQALANGNFGDLEGLVTKKIGLEDIVSEGITSLLRGEEVQVLVQL